MTPVHEVGRALHVGRRRPEVEPVRRVDVALQHRARGEQPGEGLPLHRDGATGGDVVDHRPAEDVAAGVDRLGRRVVGLLDELQHPAGLVGGHRAERSCVLDLDEVQRDVSGARRVGCQLADEVVAGEHVSVEDDDRVVGPARAATPRHCGCHHRSRGVRSRGRGRARDPRSDPSPSAAKISGRYEVASTTRVTPAACALASWCRTKGTPATGSIGLGQCTVRGRSRVPRPPTRRTASTPSMTAEPSRAPGRGSRMTGEPDASHSLGHHRPRQPPLSKP